MAQSEVCLVCGDELATVDVGSAETISSHVIALLGYRAWRYVVATSVTQKVEGELAVFSPLGHFTLVARRCIRCKDASRDAVKSSSRRRRRNAITAASAWMPVLILFIFFSDSFEQLLPKNLVAGLAVGFAALLVPPFFLIMAFVNHARRVRSETLEHKLTKSEVFKQGLQQAAESVDFTKLSFKNPEHHQPGQSHLPPLLQATKDQNLLFVVDTDRRFARGKAAIDTFEGRHWYMLATTSGKAVSGFHGSGKKGSFGLEFTKFFISDMQPGSVVFEDDPNKRKVLGPGVLT